MSTILSDRDHVLHPWGRLHPPKDSDFMLEGDGVHVKDGQGRTLLDGIAGLWCVNVGYRRREIADAMAEQAMRLPFYTAFMESGNLPSTQLARALAAGAPGDLPVPERHTGVRLTLALNAVAVVALGLFPQALLELCQRVIG